MGTKVQPGGQDPARGQEHGERLVPCSADDRANTGKPCQMQAIPKRVMQNVAAGETFVVLESGHDNGGRRFVFDWVVQPGGGTPFAHHHPNQVESFEVLQGQAAATVDGKPVCLQPGERLRLRRDASHSVRNAGQEPLRVRVQYEPALRTEESLQVICGLSRRGRVDAEGAPAKRHLALLATRHPGEAFLDGLPVWLQRLGMRLLASMSAGRRGEVDPNAYEARNPCSK